VNVKEMKYLVVAAAIVAVTALLTNPSRLFAGGIEVPMQSARAAGMADAFTAQADDASAIFYNPAGLTQIEGTHAMLGAYFLYTDYDLAGDAGLGDEHTSKLTILPHFYLASDFGLKKWRFGLGINNVHGINEDWGDNGQFRTIVDKAQLAVINIAPTLAYEFNEHLSAGVALNIYYGNMLLTRNVVLGAPPTPEGEFHYRADAWAVGFTPSVLWTISPKHSVGAYYRSPVSLDFDGVAQVKMNQSPIIGPSDANATLDLPQSVGVGYAYRPNDKLVVEFDLIWVDWSTIESLPFTSSNPAFDGQEIPADWDSGFTYRLGTEYKVDRHWAVRAGYAFGENAVPDSTFSPLVPDSDYHLFALGAGYSATHWKVDVSGQYIYRVVHDVHGSVNSPAVDGQWHNNMVGLMATFSVNM
jgi:long-chain fatty acid transport protein